MNFSITIIGVDDQGARFHYSGDIDEQGQFVTWAKLRELAHSKDIVSSRVYPPVLLEAEQFYRFTSVHTVEIHLSNERSK